MIPDMDQMQDIRDIGWLTELATDAPFGEVVSRFARTYRVEVVSSDTMLPNVTEETVILVDATTWSVRATIPRWLWHVMDATSAWVVIVTRGDLPEVRAQCPAVRCDFGSAIPRPVVADAMFHDLEASAPCQITRKIYVTN